MNLPKFIVVSIAFLLFFQFVNTPIFAFGDKTFQNSSKKSLHQFQVTIIQNKDIGIVDKTSWAADPANGTIADMMNGFTTMIGGYTPAAIEEAAALGIDTSQYANAGVLNIINQSIGFMYKRPATSTSEYFADLGTRLNLVNPVYAQQEQGLGWSALSPVLEIWKAFRNIAYLGFVLIFVVIGFMIMFRSKINPQTVITIQDALPKIVITLLLVTFSYAIAGFMIDLIYILIYLFVGIFDMQGLISSADTVRNALTGKNLFELFYDGSVFHAIPGTAINETVKNLIPSDIFDTIIGYIGGDALFSGILAIAFLFTLFRVFISLLMAYVGIIVSVIFSPITLLTNALPGSKSFGNWIKGLLANILPFPVIAIMFLLAAVLMGSQKGSACDKINNPWCVNEKVGFMGQVRNNDENGAWMPPFLITTEAETFMAFIGMGILFMMPQVISQLKKMLKVEPSGFGGTIMGGLMAAPSAVAGFGQTALGLTSQVMSVRGQIKGGRTDPGVISRIAKEGQQATKGTAPDSGNQREG